MNDDFSLSAIKQIVKRETAKDSQNNQFLDSFLGITQLLLNLSNSPNIVKFCQAVESEIPKIFAQISKFKLWVRTQDTDLIMRYNKIKKNKYLDSTAAESKITLFNTFSISRITIRESVGDYIVLLREFLEKIQGFIERMYTNPLIPIQSLISLLSCHTLDGIETNLEIIAEKLSLNYIDPYIIVDSQEIPVFTHHQTDNSIFFSGNGIVMYSQSNLPVVSVYYTLSLIFHFLNESIISLKYQSAALESLLLTEEKAIAAAEILGAAQESSCSERAILFTADQNQLKCRIGVGFQQKISLSVDALDRILDGDNHEYDSILNYQTKSMISQAIYDSDDSINGVIVLLNTSKEQYSERDRENLEYFTHLISVALGNSNLESIVKYTQRFMQKRPNNTNQKLIQQIRANIATITEQDSLINVDDVAEIPDRYRSTTGEISAFETMKIYTPDLSNQNTLKLLFYIADEFGIFKRLQISATTLLRFFDGVFHSYINVPYHNKYHSIDVTHALFILMKRAKLIIKFTPIERLVLFLASLCHDSGHQGHTNTYLLKNETPHKLIANNNSLNEVVHFANMIPICAEITENLSKQEYQSFWKLSYELVISTDLNNYNEVMNKWKEIKANGFDINDDDHRHTLMKLLIETADLTNVARPFEIAKEWNHRACQEKTSESGMTLTTYQKAENMIFVIDKFCKPLFVEVAAAFQELKFIIDDLEANYERCLNIKRSNE